MKLTFKYHQLAWFLSSIIIISFVVFYVGLSESAIFNVAAVLTMLLSLIGLGLMPDKPFTLSKMIYIFIFFFFGVIPLNDLVQNNLYYSGPKVDSDIQTLTMLIISISTLFFLILNVILDKFFRLSIDNRNKIDKPQNKPSLVLACLLFSLITFLVFYFSDFSIAKIMFRGLIDESMLKQSTISKPLEMLMDFVLKPMPIIFFIYLHWRLKDFALSFSERLVLFFICIISVFLVLPTSVPRFLAAALYIPMILRFTNFWKKPYLMSVFILASLLLIFPILNNFRRFEPGKPLFKIDFDFMNHGHFDAFQNFCRVIELNIVTGGKQLLGSLFFFVPRGVWETKPIGSGATLAEQANLAHPNISMPFLAEGFINFGIFGVFLFCFIICFLSSYFDVKFWSARGKKSNSIIFYYISFGLVFFIMRGDLLSSTAFLFGVFFSFLVVKNTLDIKC